MVPHLAPRPLPEGAYAPLATRIFHPDYRQPYVSPSSPPPPRPPRKNEKEVKIKPGNYLVWRIFDAAFDAFTETQDFTNAIFEALPENRQKERGRFLHRFDTDGRLRKIYDHFDEIDWHEALQNVIVNQIEDAIIGKANRKVSEVAAQSGQFERVFLERLSINLFR